MGLIILTTVSFVVTLLITPVVARYAVHNRIFDIPGGRRVHERPVPRLGGVAVFVGVAAGLYTIYIAYVDPISNIGALPHPPGQLLLAVGTGATITFLTGLGDDLRGLRPTMKLAMHICAGMAVYMSGVREEVVSLGHWGTVDVATPWLSLPFTIFWIVAVTHAFNLIDGLDGLASGLAVISMLFTAVVSSVAGNFDVLVLAIVVVATLLAFLIYNFNPAKIFLGDSGSYLVGFIVSVLVMSVSFRHRGLVPPVAVPILFVGVPVLDVLLSI